MMLVYDDVITRITVFCILFLFDNSQHQCYQSHTSDKHQQGYQQLTGITQMRGQIQTGSHSTKCRDTFESQCHDGNTRFEYAQCENKNE